MARITRFERYQEALAYLRESAAAIDQAHAVLKDIECDDISIEARGGAIDVLALSNQVEAMVREVETAECGDCGHELSKHSDPRYGCDHERGDVPVRGRDGHCIDVASGPCSCAWGGVAKVRKAA